MLAGRERLVLLVLVTASTAIRTACAFDRPSPLLYPDEYLYSTLARSIAATGVPTVRGAFPHFPALLGPYLMSPAWLVHDVDVAYRLALAWESLWFSLAAVPAYALGKRLGLTSCDALFIALVALLVPDAAYTSTLLSEPFAYPVFLTVVLVAVDAIATPTPRRQLSLLGLMTVLCFARLQFVVMPLAYLAAAFATSRFSLTTLVRRQALVVIVLALLAVAVLLVGPQHAAGAYAGIGTMHLPTLEVVRWFGLDLFVLAIAAGWVIVPGAAAGLVGAVGGPDERRRAFAMLTLATTFALVGQAAFFGANEGRAHERYVFYIAPLLAVAFTWRDDPERTRVRKTVAYSAAAAAVFLPLASGIRAAADDESPSLLGLGRLAGGGDRGTLLWACGLAIAAVAAGLSTASRSHLRVVALALLTSIGCAGTLALLGFGSTLDQRLNVPAGIPRLHAPPGSAIVTSTHTNEWLLMKTLFWNPNVTRVLVVGGGAAADRFASTGVRLEPGKGLVDDRGTVVPGPFVVDADTFAEGGPSPAVLLFGWSRSDRYLDTVAWLDASAGARPVEIGMSLTSAHGRKRMDVACGAAHRLVDVGAQPVRVALHVATRSTLTCRLALVGGTAVEAGNRTVSVRARLSVRG